MNENEQNKKLVVRSHGVMDGHENWSRWGGEGEERNCVNCGSPQAEGKLLRQMDFFWEFSDGSREEIETIKGCCDNCEDALLAEKGNPDFI